MSRARAFGPSMVVGELGVELCLGQWAPYLGPLTKPPASERRWDLEGPGGRPRVEVKTDTYAHTKTGNFFMERHTNVAGGDRLLGGPWRAARDGVDVLVYVFLNPTPVAFVWFDVPALVEALDVLAPTCEVRRVRMGRLQATGILVPRKAVGVGAILQ